MGSEMCIRDRFGDVRAVAVLFNVSDLAAELVLPRVADTGTWHCVFASCEGERPGWAEGRAIRLDERSCACFLFAEAPLG